MIVVLIYFRNYPKAIIDRLVRYSCRLCFKQFNTNFLATRRDEHNQQSRIFYMTYASKSQNLINVPALSQNHPI